MEENYMKTKTRSWLFAICALLMLVCAFFGVSLTKYDASAAGTEVSISGTDISISEETSGFVFLKITGSDWANATGNFAFKANTEAGERLMDLDTFSCFGNQTLAALDPYYNLWGRSGVMVVNYRSVSEFTFPKGTKFPSYSYANTGTGDVYVLSQAVTFTKTDSTWTRTVKVETTKVDVTENVTMSHASDYAAYQSGYNVSALEISLGGETLTSSAYYVNDHATTNGVDWASYIYINDVSVRSALTANKNGETKYKHTVSGLVMTNGGVYAPVGVYCNTNKIELKIMNEYVAAQTFTVTLKAGFEWKIADGKCLTISEDVTYGYENGSFVRSCKEVDVTKDVVMKDLGWNDSKDYTMLTLSLGGHSVLPLSGKGAHYANVNATVNGTDILSYLEVNEVNVRETVTANATNKTYTGTESPMTNGEIYAPVCVYVTGVTNDVLSNTIQIKILESYATEKDFYITLKAGFTWKNDKFEKLTVTEDITYGYVNGVFTQTTIDHTVEISESDITVTENKDYRNAFNLTYLTVTFGDKNMLAFDGASDYIANDHPTTNGMDWASKILINGTSVRGIVDANKTSRQYQHTNGSTFPLSLGGQYAPISVKSTATGLTIQIMQEYVDFRSFTLTISPFAWKNTDKDVVTLTTASEWYYAGNELVRKSAVTEKSLDDTIGVENVSTDAWNSKGSYEIVKIDFSTVKFSESFVAGASSPFRPMDTDDYKYLQEYVLINEQSVKTINANSTYTVPSEFPANAGSAYAVPVQLCIITDNSGLEGNGLFLRIQKERYEDWKSEGIEIKLKKGLSVYDADAATVYTLSADFSAVVEEPKVTITVVDASGKTLNTVESVINAKITLPDPCGANEALLGWKIGEDFFAPNEKYTAAADATVTAVTLAFYMKDGASIRVSGDSGIRFTYLVDGNAFDAYKTTGTILSDGIILLPTDSLGEKDFTLANFTEGETIIKSARQEGTILAADADDASMSAYIVRLTQIKEVNYARAFSARGFVEVQYSDGSTGYVYTTYNESKHSRSPMQVAQLCKDSGNGEYANMTEEQKAVVDYYISTGEANQQSYVIKVTENTADAVQTAYKEALGLSEGVLSGKKDVVIQLPANTTIQLSSALSFSGARTASSAKKIRFVGNDTTISGGAQITGWTATTVNSKTAYVAENVSYDAIRQLYVNGKPATLARTSNTTGTLDENSGVFTVATSGLSGITVSGSMEISTLERWAQCYGVVTASTSGSNYQFTLTADSAYVYGSSRGGYADEQITLFLQNSLNFLDEANEFYYDKENEKLYYIPTEGVDMSTAEIFVPTLESLLTTSGMVDDVSFENITFAYSKFDAPATYGYCEQQATVYAAPTNGAWTVLQKAITVASNDVTFTGCTIRATGANGIGVELGASNVTLDGNRFEYTAGSAVFVGTCHNTLTNIPSNVSVTHNKVSSYGFVYGGAAGITVTFADTAVISHNTIEDGYYSGISAGWGWTGNASGGTQHKNYTITYNRIINAMGGDLYDGGGIYLLGNFTATSESVVAYNYVEISSKCLAAIYLDEGTSDYSVHDNALKVTNVTEGAIFLHNNKNENDFGMANISISDNYSNVATCKYKFAKDGKTQSLGANSYNKANNITYANPTKSSTTYVNESIYIASGSRLG